MLDDFNFIAYALLGGIGLSLISGPLGSFIVWRKMAYLGDTLSHSALLGIALSILSGIMPILAIVLVCFTISILMLYVEHYKKIAPDTYLGIASHSSLALGLVLFYVLEGKSSGLLGLLLGDILAITKADLWVIYGGSFLCLGVFYFLWKPLLAITFSEEIALTERINIARTKLIFILMLSAIIAFSVKIVGVLLITSLLIIPAATAKAFAKTPVQMAVIASCISAASVILGILGSFTFDFPTGPAIVLTAAGFFGMSFLKRA